MQSMVFKLDEYGKPAWIALMIAGFILFWPVGLATLAFLIWSGRMGCRGNMDERRARWIGKFERKMERWGGGGYAYQSSGNRAFDDYRSETLRRLEDEQREFHDFVARLKMAKDKQEFDQFMADRRNTPPEPRRDDEAPRPNLPQDPQGWQRG